MQITDSLIGYVLILILVSLVLLLIGIVTHYLRLVNEFSNYRRGLEKTTDPQVLIAQAQRQAQKILEEAYTQSRQIISKTEDFLKKEEGELAKELDKSTDVYTKLYQDALSSSQKQSLQMLQNLPQDIKITLISAVDSFRISLTQEVTKAQATANAGLREAYSKAFDELQKYKEDRMKQVDSSILSIVRQVSERVISKDIDVEEHEKLVLRSLEEAKRENLI